MAQSNAARSAPVCPPEMIFWIIPLQIPSWQQQSFIHFHEYWPVLVTDGTMQAGPPAAHQATIFNVESFFGWTMPAAGLIESLEADRGAGSPPRVAASR